METSKKVKKSTVIYTRVTIEEHQKISEKAAMCNVKVSRFLRNLSLGYPLASKVDQLAFLELGKCRADLGRLGGLLKMALTSKDKRVDENSLKELLERIEKNQDELLNLANKMIETKK